MKFPFEMFCFSPKLMSFLRNMDVNQVEMSTDSRFYNYHLESRGPGYANNLTLSYFCV